MSCEILPILIVKDSLFRLMKSALPWAVKIHRQARAGRAPELSMLRCKFSR